MKERKYRTAKNLIAAAILLYLMVPLAHAELTLGSAISKDHLVLRPGQQELIEVSLFNTGSDDMEVYIEQATLIETSLAKKDLKIQVIQEIDHIPVIEPTVTLPATEPTRKPPGGSGMTWITTGKKGDTYYPAKKVYFLIKVQEKDTYARNGYELVFNAYAKQTGSPDNSGKASVGIIGEFRIKVDIKDIITNPVPRTTNPGTPTVIHNPDNRDDSGTTYLPTYTGESDNYIRDSNPDGTEKTTDTGATQENFGNKKTAPDESNSMGTGSDGDRESITGLATQERSSPVGPYNIVTIVIIIIGIFILYNIIRK